MSILKCNIYSQDAKGLFLAPHRAAFFLNVTLAGIWIHLEAQAKLRKESIHTFSVHGFISGACHKYLLGYC